MRNDAAREAFRGPRDKTSDAAMGVSRARCGVDARIAPPFMEATDASRLVCVVVVSHQEYSLYSHTHIAPFITGEL